VNSMAEPFRDNALYDFCIIQKKKSKHRGNPAMKFTFGCINNDEEIREILPINNPIDNTRLHKFMVDLGFKDVDGVEPIPENFFKRGMTFKAKVMLQYSEGAKESRRYRINFDTVAKGGRVSNTYTKEQVSELKSFVGDIKTKEGVVGKFRMTDFEHICLYCDMIRDSVIDLQ